MSIIKPTASHDFIGKTVDGKITFGGVVVNALTTNAGIFTMPDIPVATLQILTTNLSNALSQTATNDSQKIAFMHVQEKIWDDNFRLEADYVSRIAQGNESTIGLGGFTPTKNESLPMQKTAQAIITKLFADQIAGQVHVEIEHLANARAYILIVSANSTPLAFATGQLVLPSPANVISIKMDTHRKMMLQNLPSTGVYVQAFGFNSAGWGLGSTPMFVKVG